MSSFSISKQNIKNKLLQTFCLNFNWVFAIMMLIAAMMIIYMIVKNKRKLDESYIRFIVINIAVLVAELLFFSVYFDFQHPRYMALAISIVIVVALSGLLFINKIALTEMVGGLLLSLVITQSYVNIDFVSNRMFPVEKAYGSNIICSMWECIGDQSVYNREYSYYIKAVEKAMADADFDGETVLDFRTGDNPFYLTTNCYYDTEKKRFVSVRNEASVKIHLSDTKKTTRVLHIDKLLESDESNPVVKFGTVSIRYCIENIE